MKNRFLLSIVVIIAMFLYSGSFVTASEDGHSDSHQTAAEDEHGGHGKQAGHAEPAHGASENKEHGEEHGGGHGESWWRFPGWQLIFAAIACFYFAQALIWLPKLVAKEEGGHH